MLEDEIGNSTRSTASSSRSASQRPAGSHGRLLRGNGCCQATGWRCKARHRQDCLELRHHARPDRRHPPPSGPAPTVAGRRSAKRLGVDLPRAFAEFAKTGARRKSTRRWSRPAMATSSPASPPRRHRDPAPARRPGQAGDGPAPERGKRGRRRKGEPPAPPLDLDTAAIRASTAA